MNVQFDNSALVHLRALESEEAAAWLVEKYPISNPDYWVAFKLISARSWRKSEQKSLARYYLCKKPFAHDGPYRVFSKIMSLSTFVMLLREFVPNNPDEIQLYSHHKRWNICSR